MEIGEFGNLAGIEPRLTSGQLRKAALISATAAPLIRTLGTTYRWRVSGYEHYESIVASGKQPIFAFWHGRILPATLFWKDRGIVVITSQNFDGEWIAGIITRFGYGTARGSTSRGATRALIQLKRALAAGKPAGFTVDGPRGPARVSQPGAVWLAKATGNPIMPFHMEASPHWTAPSWDASQIPRPFARVAVAMGEPMWVPADAGEGRLEAARIELEHRLNALKPLALGLLEQ